MKRSLALLALPVCLLAAPTSARGGDPLVITHVTVIDASGAPPRPDMSVEVRDHRIAFLGPTATARPSEDARVVDATGKVLIPGLWDMHVHTGQRDVYLPLYVANGVTGVRDMGGDLEEPTGYSSARYVQLRLWRSAIEEGALLGPRMLLAGFLIDGVPWPGNVVAASPDEGRRAVDLLAELGVDFIKVKGLLAKETYLAIAVEARRRHMALAGHVPGTVRAAEASEAGQRSIEHLSGVTLGCSRLETELMAEMAEAFAARDLPRYERAESRALETFDEKRAAELFAEFVRNGTWQVPTLVELRRNALGGPTADDPRSKYLPASLRERWRGESRPSAGTTGLARLAGASELVRRLHEAGVPVMAGTDSANPTLLPGFSLHDELELLVAAGFTPMQALQAATLAPAQYLGRQGELGTVEAGKLADLVLLDADPLVDIANTRKIAAVVVNGRYLDRAELNAMLARVESGAQ